MKASLTLGVLLGMFFVTWLPFFVASIVQVMPPLGVGESPPCWEALNPPEVEMGREAGRGALHPGSRMSPCPTPPGRV